MLNNLITGQYADYQEYPFPFTIFSDSDGGLNKDALYYLDCGNGTLFQIVGDKRATKSQDGETAKGHEIPQQISIWGFLSEDDTDMAAFGMAANCMIFLTDPEDDGFSKSADIMLDLTNDHFGQFVQHGAIEYKFDYYPDGYDGKPAVFFKDGENVVRDDLPGAVDAAVEQGWAAKGTLAECAEVFGMKNLEATVEAYNALCDAGEDTQYYKAPYLLHELSGDTFYVFEYEPSIWSTFGGVKTDDYCRALSKDQSVIPGLYVAGVDNGSLYCSPYYENEGASLGIAYTSGIVAADCMIDYLNS